MSRLFATLLLLLGATPLIGQTVTVRVRSDTGPIPGALVRLLDPTGAVRTDRKSVV